MKAYICLPEDLFVSNNNSDYDKIKNYFQESLRKYYGSLDFDIVSQKDIESIIIYIMGRAKYDDFQDDIRSEIYTIVRKLYGDDYCKNLQIKLNYGAFNPNFNPKQKIEANKTIKLQTEKSNMKNQSEKSNEFDYEKLSYNYQAENPRFTFDQVILPKKTLEQVEEAIGILEVEEKVFDEWGLRSIIPEANSVLSFYGPPGTGKTMTAEAIAHKLGKKILRATYADIESKYHGEGPKMVKAIFRAAERDDAVLFLDESDSLLSKRLTNVSDGSAQAINSMRSQLLISLESFKGIVIFATNLVVNYDKAFLSRLINIEFVNPTFVERKKIWENHIKSDKVHIPLADDVDVTVLAEKYDLCGREIKNAVKNACVSAALKKKDLVSHEDFIKACERVVEERIQVISAKDQTHMGNIIPSEGAKDKLKQTLQKKINSGEIVPQTL